LEIGMDSVIHLAQKCHLTGTLQPYPSLALGCIDTTLLPVVGMFNIFANTGLYVEPYTLVWIKDRWGNKIWKHTPQKPERVLDTRTSGQVTKTLTLGMDRLHKRYCAQWPKVAEAIVNTGTTNKSRTCWLMGSTPTFTTGIYIGCDDNRPMGDNVFPVHTAFPIWLDFNRNIDHCRKQFLYDPSLKEIVIDERTGKLVSGNTTTPTIHVMI
jgi:membrane carboxypeptidase/penicillin-binding protein